MKGTNNFMENLKDTLFYDKKPAFDKLGNEKFEQAQQFCKGYKTFLDEGKTERDCVRFSVAQAEKCGFIPYSEDLQLKAGMKIYKVNHKKAITLVVIGKEPLAKGANITAAHIDAPRIDVRTIPLYEDSDMAFFKTHYYGGIKKYQWTAIPLELRGTVIAVDGTNTREINISIGNKEDDPVFTITDLLPHLAVNQMSKKMTEGITGEGLNILIGSKPSDSEKEGADRIKLMVLEHLNCEYGITEKDFLCAELSLVPAFNARDIGFDRSFIGAYGQDDRICSYTALRSLLDLEEIPEKTAICVLVDREEIGSEGITGMQSREFDGFMEDLCQLAGTTLRRLYENSICLSADVANAYDPNYADVSEKRNDARVNCGLVITKYTGARGKSDASEASAEMMARVRIIMEQAGVVWQTGQLGKVDAGGGGTVAKYMANRGIETVDAGVAVLSMHSPFEVTAKLDILMAYEGFLAFYKA